MRQTSRRVVADETEVIDRLSKRFGKYALVVGVSKRAHDLKERVRSPLEPTGGGIINRAIAEIAEGRVKIRGEEPEEETD
ncbi:MAG: DNA-directed RNA polymerase subunit omega [Armatimonadota bacterium]